MKNFCQMEAALDDLYHKKESARGKALSLIITHFTENVQVEFAEKSYFTLVYRSLSLLKKGSSKEVSLATQAIALFALTLGPGDSTHEIYRESITNFSQALETGSVSSKILPILDCLAIVTFVGARDFEETEESMQIVWKLIQRVNDGKHLPAILAAALSAWSFLLTTVDSWRLNYKYCEGPISNFSDLIEHDDESVRVAALEALALIFESGCLNSFPSEAKCSSSFLIHEGNTSTNGYSSIQERMDNIRHRVTRLSSTNEGYKDHKEFLKVFEDCFFFKTTVMNWQNIPKPFEWYHSLQSKYMKRILGSGFDKHMEDNEFLLVLFKVVTTETEDISDTKCDLYEIGKRKIMAEYYEHELLKTNKVTRKRMFKSPNSFRSKARSQLLNKERKLVKEMHNGHYLGEDY